MQPHVQMQISLYPKCPLLVGFLEAMPDEVAFKLVYEKDWQEVRRTVAKTLDELIANENSENDWKGIVQEIVDAETYFKNYTARKQKQLHRKGRRRKK